MLLDESIALLIVGIGQPVGDLQCPVGGLSIGKLGEEPPALAEGFLDATLLLEVGIQAGDGTLLYLACEGRDGGNLWVKWRVFSLTEATGEQE